jgi:hydrophobic/amphiphilic exporter-1 (mainly G- bacteria), HAE1 family
MADWWRSSSLRRFRAWAASADFQFMLQDQGGNTLTDLDRVAHRLWAPARAQGSERADHHFSANDPQILVTIDREKAKAMDVSLVADHHRSRRLHGLGVYQRLRLQQPHLSRLCAGRSALPHDGKDLHSYYVRSDSGQMVPLDNLITVTESSGAAGDFALQSLPRR